MTGPGLYRITPAGEVALVSSGAPCQPARVPNHPAFLPDGTLVWTESGEWGADDGCLFATTAKGTTIVADRSACRFPNGLALSPDGTVLAVVESTLPGVSVLSVGADSTLGERRVLVELPGTVPDGVAYEAAGGLLIACWMPDAILRLTPAGEVETLAHDPLRFSLNSPTNVAFVPGERRVVAANIGERFLSVLPAPEHGAQPSRPEFPWTG
jgi:gluconolactonase